MQIQNQAVHAGWLLEERFRGGIAVDPKSQAPKKARDGGPQERTFFDHWNGGDSGNVVGKARVRLVLIRAMAKRGEAPHHHGFFRRMRCLNYRRETLSTT